MNKQIAFLIPALFISMSLSAQQKKTPVTEKSKTPAPATESLNTKTNVYNYVEQMPNPGFDVPGYLNKNIHYPKDAIEQKVQGRVIVRFVVNEDGGISDVTIVRGIGGSCDKEAQRVVMAMPKWKPGKQTGKPVKVYYTLPIVFELTEPEPEPENK